MGRRLSARSAARGALWGLAIAHVAEALVLRQRRENLVSLPPPDEDAAAGPISVLSVAGAGIDEATRVAARQDMTRHGIEVLDLLPGDLPVERWLRFLRRVDPATLGADAMKSAGGAHEAVALDPATAERMRIEGDQILDRAGLAHETVRAQRYAPNAHDLRVAPGMRSSPYTPTDRWRELEEVTNFAWPFGAWAPLLTAVESSHLLAMTAGVFVAPVPALAALATWCAQPVLALRTPVGDASSFTPAQLGEAGALRLPRALANNLRTIATGYHATKDRERKRAETPLPRVPSTEELFEPRRATCPWCGSPSLAGRLDVPDMLTSKPGTFHLDECQDCGHIFQNPRLTIAGLDYYYEHTYDGDGEEMAEISFASLGDNYRSRVASLARFTTPTALLDVGTGHAHFLLTARQQWPDAVFDGLDMSDSVEEAQRRGRVDTAYRGMFPQMADSFPRTYDAVTMHHYLEHTREPRLELAAVTKVLEPGGYLMVEMPDAEHSWARTLGPYWYQWAQPEHQHIIPCRNLVKELEDTGFEVLSVERGPVTLGNDVFNAVPLFLQRYARSSHLAWLPKLSLAHRVKRVAMWTAALPVMVVARIVDRVKEDRLDPESPSNSYRIVARRI